MERLTDEEIKQNLRVYGFQLGWSQDETVDKPIAVEDLIIDILRGVNEPRYINGIPVLIAKNKEQLRFDYLVERAEEEGVVNALGWILEETKGAFERTRIIYPETLTEVIKKAEASKKQGETFLGHDKSDWYLDYAAERRNELEKKWGIVEPYSSHEFDRLLRVYRCIRHD